LTIVAKVEHKKMKDVSSIEDDLTEIKITVKEIAVHQKQLVQDIKNHSKTLYGMEGRNGLVGDVRDIRTTASVLKWVSGGGLITAISAWITRLNE
jgi:hypothetical protein